MPDTDVGLSKEELESLKGNLGIETKSEANTELVVSWQHKSSLELKQSSKEQSKSLCKSYGRPFSNKKKDKLVETVLLGPVINQSITEIEFLKYSFLQPLPQEDRSAHKLGSSNEE